jgi:hypothetical protein
VRELLAALLLPLALAGADGADGASVELTFRDPDIVESSGLAVVGDWVVTTNDSGDTGRVFAVDRSGETVGVTGWGDPRDVEALAPAGGHSVWVGDIGDNTAGRDSVEVTEVPVTGSNGDVDGPHYELVYPDGARDAETLLCDPTTGRLYVATKEIFGGVLYEAPATLDRDRPNRLHEVGEVLPIATDGAFFPDGRHLVIRDYDRAVVYSFPALEEVGVVDLPRQEQGEGIAVTDHDDLLVSTEGQFSDVLRVPLPAELRAAVAPAASPTATPPETRSREGKELPESTEVRRSPWPWFLGGFAGLGIIVVLMRALRRR